AARRGLELAARHQARAEGLGIVNSAYIQRPEAVPIGGMAYKTALDMQELRNADERVALVLRDFQQQADGLGASPVHARQVDGDPFAVIEVEAASHDLIVLGHRSMFDVEGEIYELPVCVDRIIRTQPRPVLLVPDEERDGATDPMKAPVLVAFDGSPASSRAVHMFALLGLAAGRKTHVVTLDEASAEEAEATARRACVLLERHGAAETQAIGLGDRDAGTPAETILGMAKTLAPDTIVMGAYGHRGLREMFGSCTSEVLNACPAPLFLHH
ncbi:MAG TPA: universal stress protein, partial [Beijerinckiaceae bacterium]